MLGLKVRDFAIWIVYCVMLAMVVPWHEPWSNEAQAWLLARELSIPKLLLYYLRYEGHPALWYLVLWGPAHLHWSYAAMSWISAAIAAAGIYVLLRFSPFPFYLRALLPFTYFLAYQYGVVARSYVLFPLLCFLIAHVYRLAKPRPVPMAVLLALLANVSVHGTLVACALAVAYCWELFRRRRTAAISGWGVAAGAALFVASLVLVGITIRPPSDFAIVTSPVLSRVLHVLHWGAGAVEQSQAATPPVSQPLGVAPIAVPPRPHGVLAHLRELPRVLSYAVSTHRLFSMALYLVAAVYLCMRKQFLLLGPLAVLTLFLVFVYAREWHLGQLWIVLLMVLWAAWDEEAKPGRFGLQTALAGLLALASLLQLPWTWDAIAYDRQSQYDPSREVAAYLHTVPAGLRIAGFGDAHTILPYFSSNIFFNLPTAYVFNGRQTGPYADFAAALAAHPDMLVIAVAVWSGDTSMIAQAELSGYYETHRFCGAMFLPNVERQEICQVVLEPESAPVK